MSSHKNNTKKLPIYPPRSQFSTLWMPQKIWNPPNTMHETPASEQKSSIHFFKSVLFYADLIFSKFHYSGLSFTHLSNYFRVIFTWQRYIDAFHIVYLAAQALFLPACTLTLRQSDRVATNTGSVFTFHLGEHRRDMTVWDPTRGIYVVWG